MKHVQRPVLLLLIPLIFLIYMGDMFMEYPLRMPDHYTRKAIESSEMLVKVSQPVKIKRKSIQVEAEMMMLSVRDDTIRCSGKVLLYLAKNSLAEALKYGDVLWLKGKLEKFTSSNSKGTFNPEKYYRHKRIYRYARLSEDQWLLIDSNQGNKVVAASLQVRDYVKNMFGKLFPQGQHAGTLSALFLSDKQTMDTKLLQSYRQVGLAHVLCVSGLHVGMISVAIGTFLGIFLYGNRRKIKWRAIVSVIGTFLFCFMVGWQPSVMRAAVMFAFLTLGRVWQRQGDSLNNLFLAAFVLLLWEPLWLFDLGFQLSFLSVFGILIFMPWIRKTSYGKNVAIRYLLGVTGVSLAAQCFTLPLCLYNFRQLPVLSVVANLLILPLVNVVIVSVMTACVAVPWGIGTSVFHRILEIELDTMNFLTQTIHDIPFAYVEGVKFSETELWIIYAVICTLLCIKTIYRKRRQPVRHSHAKNAGIVDIMAKET